MEVVSWMIPGVVQLTYGLHGTAQQMLVIPYAFSYDTSWITEVPMSSINATEARANLYKLLDEVAQSHTPVLITGKRTNAVLVSEDDWRSIQETVYLLSIPGMRESIREGLKVPIDACSDQLDW